MNIEFTDLFTVKRYDVQTLERALSTTALSQFHLPNPKDIPAASHDLHPEFSMYCILIMFIDLFGAKSTLCRAIRTRHRRIPDRARPVISKEPGWL